MSFKKRNIALSSSASGTQSLQKEKSIASGVKISPATSHPTISTGTPSLDRLLSLGAGQTLGTSLLIEEEGTTDFAGALLRCYAAEALVQRHKVFVVAPEGWAGLLPGVIEESGGVKERGNEGVSGMDEGRMKIAWRYERLGAHGEGRPAVPQRTPLGSATSPSEAPTDQHTFCHTFDLTKRLVLPSGTPPPTHISPSPSSSGNPFATIVSTISKHLSSATTPLLPTRLIIPSLLNPLFYPPHASQPSMLIPFLHALRSLLRQYTSTLTVIISFPLSLYPRSSVVTRWVEHLVDGVISLHPFPHSYSADVDTAEASSGSSVGKGKDDEKMQGLIRVTKLPLLSERGVGVGVGEDMAFAVGRRRVVIRPFHLPPLEGEQLRESGGDASVGGAAKEKEKALDF